MLTETGTITITRHQDTPESLIVLGYQWDGGDVVRVGARVLEHFLPEGGWVIYDTPIGTVFHVGPYRLRTIGDVDFMMLSVLAMRDGWRARCVALTARIARYVRRQRYSALRFANHHGLAATPEGCSMSWRDLLPPWQWGA